MAVAASMYLMLRNKVLSIQTLSYLGAGEVKLTLKTVPNQIQTDRGFWIEALQENENLLVTDCDVDGVIQIYDRRAGTIAKTFKDLFIGIYFLDINR